jgi:ligand-binding SRPBCC domain-containing protein
MRTYLLKRELWIARPRDDVFEFFSNAANLEQLTPPWLNFRMLTPTPLEIKVGARIDYQIRWRVVPIKWRSEIVEWDPPQRFTDLQLQGPYALWRHTHSFYEAHGGTRVVDKVQYALPLGLIGNVMHELKVRRDLETIFDYRAQRICEILECSECQA